MMTASSPRYLTKEPRVIEIKTNWDCKELTEDKRNEQCRWFVTKQVEGIVDGHLSDMVTLISFISCPLYNTLIKFCTLNWITVVTNIYIYRADVYLYLSSWCIIFRQRVRLQSAIILYKMAYQSMLNLYIPYGYTCTNYFCCLCNTTFWHSFLYSDPIISYIIHHLAGRKITCYSMNDDPLAPPEG